jgi:acylphosphatase
MAAPRTVHLLIAGRVQGVGYRMWMQHEALIRGVNGWVRNRHGGAVEAVLSGDGDAVEAVVDACWAGPPSCEVAAVDVTDSTAPAPPGFRVLPTA